MTRPNWLFLLALFVLPGLLGSAKAQSRLLLDEALPSQEVSSRMMWIADPGGLATVQDIAQGPDNAWQQLSGPFSMGFTKSAIWVRLEYTTLHTSDSSGWWFEVAQPTINEVDFYQQDTHGQWQKQAGRRTQPGTLLQFQNHRAMVALSDAPQRKTLYVRLATPTSMSTGFTVWKPYAWVNNRSSETLIWGIFYGLNALMIVFYGVYAFWTRNRLQGLYATYMLNLILISWFTGSWHVHLTSWGSSETWTLLLGVAFASINFIAMLFDFEFLQIRQTRPRLTQSVLWVTGAWAALCTLGVLLGYYQPAVPLAQAMAIALIFMNIYLGISELRNGNPRAKLFLFAFGIFYVGLLIRIFRNLGLIEPNNITENSYQIAVFLHALTMGISIFKDYNRLQLEKTAAMTLAESEQGQRQRQSEFLGLVAHELRTPLTIISTAAENLQNAKLNQPETDRVAKILRATQRMRSIIEGYLNAERLTQPLTAATLQKVSLFNLCRQSVQMAQEKTPHPVRLVADQQFDYSITCDALQLQVALDNLIGNAISHSRPLSEVEVVLGTQNGCFKVEVINLGDQIPSNDLPHIFERFYRGKNAMQRSGSGLGLYIVHQIAQQHQGQVTAENLPDGRCRFVMTLAKKNGAATRA